MTLFPRGPLAAAGVRAKRFGPRPKKADTPFAKVLSAANATAVQLRGASSCTTRTPLRGESVMPRNVGSSSDGSAGRSVAR